MKYHKRILAFIDILGFSEMVNNTIDKEDKEINDKTDIIYNFFEDAQKLLNRSYNNNKETDSRVVNHFSDSIVISYLETEEGGVFRCFTDVIFLLLTALHKKILLRGSIVCDWLFHENNKIFGPALVKAYNIEKNIAIYPRVVFNKELLDIANMYPANWINKSDRNTISNELITKDFDGLYYFDYIKIINYFTSDNNSIYFNLLRKAIEYLDNSNDMKKYSKYLWLKEKYFELFNK